MLRIIFMDVNPYVVDGKELNEATWNDLASSGILLQYINREPILTKFFEKKKSLFNFQDEYLKVLDSKLYQELVNAWDGFYQKELENYLNTKKIPSYFTKLLDDAEQNNIEVVLVTNNKNFENLDKKLKTILKKDINLLMISNFNTLDINLLLNYAAQANASYEEIAVITQQEATIKNLLENNIFALTVGNDFNVNARNFIHLESNENINLEEILYNFYEYVKVYTVRL